jgi:CRISPR-associated protein Csm2
MNPGNYNRGGGPGRPISGGQRPVHQAGAGGGRPNNDESNDLALALKSTEAVSYRDGDGRLRPELLDKEAQDAAKGLGDITTTQLRKFFEQVGAIKRRIDVDSSLSDSEILAQMAFLKASAAYAAARDKDRRNKPVLAFVVKHANSVRERKDFLDFHRHFETVVAFHKVYGKESKGN